jgi:hypothetical protein
MPDADVDIPSGLNDDDFYFGHTGNPFGDVHHLDDDNMMCDDAEARPTHTVTHSKVSESLCIFK